MTSEQREFSPQFDPSVFQPLNYLRTGLNDEAKAVLDEEGLHEEEAVFFSHFLNMLDGAREMSNIQGVLVRTATSNSGEVFSQFEFLFDNLIPNHPQTEKVLETSSNLIRDMKQAPGFESSVLAIGRCGDNFDRYLRRQMDLESRGEAKTYFGESLKTDLVVRFVD